MRTDEERQIGTDYATEDHFCRIFQTDVQSLYLLAFLLTANHEHATRSFIAGMEETLNEHRVFKEWARTWSRRIVMKNAIRLAVAPSAQSHEQPDHWAEAGDKSPACMTISTITQLASFDRIVFVMTVLEGYSEWECALLLGCSARDVQRARIRTLQQLPALYPAAAAHAGDSHRATEQLQREYERSRP